MADIPDLSPTPAQAAQTALLASWLEGLPEPHILFDRGYRIVATNGAYRRQFGQGAPVVGRTCHAVSHHSPVPCDQAGETCPLARSLFSGQRERVLHLHHTPAGEEYVQIELVPLRDEAGQPQYFLEKMEPLRIAQGQPGAPGMIGRAPAFQAVLELIARVGPSQASVLLLGESGTGKELAARAVHEASPRAGRPLVVVDCASLPETLFESELFGHERGAFTCAHAARAGLVEAAHGGTLFLDEVGDIPLPMQVKLLRLLETGTYRRVGSTEPRHADIRVISATHRHLEQMIHDGRFREDLYYRLSTFPIELPALRERRDDIPLLAAALLERVAAPRRLSISPAAMELLQAQPFPGNVRELRNLMERAALLCDGDTLDLAHVEQALRSGRPAPHPIQPDTAPMPAPGSPAAPTATPGAARPPDAPAGKLRALEQAALLERVARHTGSRAALAAELGISERTLYRKLRAAGAA